MRIGERGTLRPLVLGTLVVALASGCGTVVSKGVRNQTAGAAHGSTGLGHPYTGIRCDAAYVRGMSRAGWGVPRGLFGLVDMPFSLFEDTVFLPLDLIMSSDQPWSADRACGMDGD